MAADVNVTNVGAMRAAALCINIADSGDDGSFGEAIGGEALNPPLWLLEFTTVLRVIFREAMSVLQSLE